MAKKTKKAVKTTKPSRLHHEVKNTDWKFVVTMIVLAIIGLGVFKIYQGLKAENPEVYIQQQAQGVSFEYNRCMLSCGRDYVSCVGGGGSGAMRGRNCGQERTDCRAKCAKKYK